MADGKELTAHQRLLLTMLKDFDAVCRKHNIRYQLFAGTALGAVREHGFIPWDDDIDVILLRSEYERFFEEAAGDFDAEIYYVQKENSAHWPMQFSKLRRNNTTCIEKYHPKDDAVHQGVYIDIFPCGNLSANSAMRRVQFVASQMIIAKALYARGYETDSVSKKLFMQLCRMFPRSLLERVCIRRREDKSPMVHSFLAAGKKYNSNVFPRTWMQDTIELQFEDGIFPLSEHYDALLTKLYGDWRTPHTPAERKSKEHVAILDLEKSYTEHLDEQRSMRVDQYTKSIR